MLINYTYFTGKINLPHTGNTEGRTLVTEFINRYENEYLQKVLGYELWKDFIAGLQEPTINQKWLDILNGVEFTHCNRLIKWVGFIPLSGTGITVSNGNLREFIAGRGNEYDPTPGSSTMVLPDEFVDEDFVVELRGTGTLGEDEYSVSGNVLTLINPTQFNDGARIYLKKAQAITAGADTALYYSPIANYVYYRFRENEASSTNLNGESVGKSDNATMVAPIIKMIDAWNEMARWSRTLKAFLNENADVYPSWDCHEDEVFETINSFGL